MKVECSGRRLYELASYASSKSTTLSITDYLTLYSSDGKAYLKSNGLDYQFSAVLGLVEGEGKMFVPIRKLKNFLRYEKESIVIESLGKTVKLSSNKRGQCNVSWYIPEMAEVPSPSTIGHVFRVDGEFMRRLGMATIYADDGNASRPILETVNIKQGDGHIKMASADGFRLFNASFPELSVAELAGGINIPASFCRLMARVFKNGCWIGFSEPKLLDSTFKTYTDSKVWFENDGLKFISSTCSGTFPKYESLIPTVEAIWKFTCSAPLLQTRCRQIDKDSYIVRLTSENEQQLKIVSDSTGKLGVPTDDSYFIALIPATIERKGEFFDVRIALNSKYLIDTLAHFSEVTFEVISTSQPVKIYGDLKNVLAVIMPMFIQWD